MARKKKLLTKDQVRRLLGNIGERTLERRIAAKQFPPSFGDGHWLQGDVDAYLHLMSRIGGKPEFDPSKQETEEEK